MEERTAKASWVADLPAAQPAKRRLASSADLSQNHEGFLEYEAVADPDNVRAEAAQRRFRGQYLRRVHRRQARTMHDRAEDV